MLKNAVYNSIYIYFIHNYPERLRMNSHFLEGIRVTKLASSATQAIWCIGDYYTNRLARSRRPAGEDGTGACRRGCVAKGFNYARLSAMTKTNT